MPNSSSYPDPPQPTVVHPPPAVSPSDTFDDMHDSPEETVYYSSLLPLASCARIKDAFETADAQALHCQKTHTRITVWAVRFGTSAVIAAIAGLAYPRLKEVNLWLPEWGEVLLDVGEFLCAAAAIAIVIYGHRKQIKENWLLYRHQAELCRLAKYRFLLSPSVWMGPETEKEKWIEDSLEKIRKLQGEEGLKTAVRQPASHGPFEGTQVRISRPQLRALVEYYVAKRLNPQKEYMANRTQRSESRDWIRDFLPWFFFASIAAVLLKFVYRNPVAARWSGHDLKSYGQIVWATLLGVAAACLPVLAAGFRTLRGAFEYSRNKSRFHAAHMALSQLEQDLLHDSISALTDGQGGVDPAVVGLRITEESIVTSMQFAQLTIRTQEQAPAPGAGGAVDAYVVLRDLSWCEHVLDAEHREWLRLMYETEWFG
jgi:hypothetical protein